MSDPVAPADQLAERLLKAARGQVGGFALSSEFFEEIIAALQSRVAPTEEMVELGARALHTGHDVIPFCDATEPKSELYFGDIKPDCHNMHRLRDDARKVLEAALSQAQRQVTDEQPHLPGNTPPPPAPTAKSTQVILREGKPMPKQRTRHE